MEERTNEAVAAPTRIINVLWTGGWDSTFRVMDLIANHDCTVQPHYVADNVARKSWQVELATMEKIRAMCESEPGRFSGRLAEPIVYWRGDIPKLPNLAESYAAMRGISYLGPQYEWLASLAEFRKLPPLELPVHRQDRTFNILAENVELRPGWPTDTFVVSPTAPEYLKVFRYFEFPLLQMTKPEMEKAASKYGFGDILEATWFCHTPISGPRPCGVCKPCRYTIADGMGRRVGWRGMIRFYTVGTALDYCPHDVRRWASWQWQKIQNLRVSRQ